MRIVFISGPYRADTECKRHSNIKCAREAAIRWVKKGYYPFTPHLNTANFDNLAPDGLFLNGALTILQYCSILYVLKGWRNSHGTMQEIKTAINLGIPIIYEEE